MDDHGQDGGADADLDGIGAHHLGDAADEATRVACTDDRTALVDGDILDARREVGECRDARDIIGEVDLGDPCNVSDSIEVDVAQVDGIHIHGGYSAATLERMDVDLGHTLADGDGFEVPLVLEGFFADHSDSVTDVHGGELGVFPRGVLEVVVVGERTGAGECEHGVVHLVVYSADVPGITGIRRRFCGRIIRGNRE